MFTLIIGLGLYTLILLNHRLTKRYLARLAEEQAKFNLVLQGLTSEVTSLMSDTQSYERTDEFVHSIKDMFDSFEDPWLEESEPVNSIESIAIRREAQESTPIQEKVSITLTTINKLNKTQLSAVIKTLPEGNFNLTTVATLRSCVRELFMSERQEEIREAVQKVLG